MANFLTYNDIYSLIERIGLNLPQKTVLPTAAANLEGKIYQYVGTTNNSYTNGRFYKCIGDGDPAVYSWVETSVNNDKLWLGTTADHAAAELAGTLPTNGLIIIDESDDSGNGNVSTAHIYGAVWDCSSSTAWTRTDEAAEFTEPSPAVNNDDGSSPFDTIMPWSGMVKEERAGGTMVKIPKYWYKWTRAEGVMKLQISPTAVEGFNVSPAHADRGDGKGERDYVYVGAYHCGGGETDTYKSKTGVLPMVGKTRSEFRTAIHNLGANIWQYDFAMYWTIAMLYLVEFAKWDSQIKIGYGCGNGTNTENNGACDAMIYHTGTNAVGRTTYGHVRYRYIEGLWDNVLDCCDGIYFNNSDIYCIKNPADFSESTGGTLVGTRPQGGWITSWSAPNVTGFEYALFPNAVGGSNSTYVSDNYSKKDTTTSLYVGGGFGRKLDRGLFCLDSTSVVSSTTDFIGSRIMELP